MRKAFIFGLVAAGSLVAAATSAAASNAVTGSSQTGASQAYPAPASAAVKKKRAIEGVLPFLIALGVGGTALFIALDDDDSPVSAG